MNIDINKSIKILELDSNIENKLLLNNIDTIEKLWKFNRIDLKKLNFLDSEINNIIIKLQLIGISLNKKTNDNDRVK